MCESRNTAAPSGSQETALPDDFHPTPYTVIIGRGQRNQETFGNKRLRILASSFLPKYSNASCKVQKSNVVSDIVATIRLACPVGAFVRFKDGRWYEVDEATAREKVGYTMRDLLHDKYRSSSKSKVARKKIERSNSKTSATLSEDCNMPASHSKRHSRCSIESQIEASHDHFKSECSSDKDLKLNSEDCIAAVHSDQFFKCSSTTEETIQHSELTSFPSFRFIEGSTESKKRFEEKNSRSEQCFQSFEDPYSKICNDFPSTHVDLSVARRRSFTRNLERIGDKLFNLNKNSLVSLGLDDVTPDFLCEDINDDIFEE